MPPTSANAIPLRPLPNIFDIQFPNSGSSLAPDLEFGASRGLRLTAAPPKPKMIRSWRERNWRFALACIVFFVLVATTWIPPAASKIHYVLASRECGGLDGAEATECWQEYGYGE